MTYSDINVAEQLNNDFVPVQVDIEKAGKLADQYHAIWTPNLNTINRREKRVYHDIGYLPPPEFSAMLGTAKGHYLFSHKTFQEAADVFDEVSDRFPFSPFAGESLYFKGVCQYLATHEVDDLVKTWTALQQKYPASEWAIKSNIL